MPYCISGYHFWSDHSDSEKCCNPKWKRILLLGPAAKQGDSSICYDQGAESLYSRKWVKTDVTGS